MSRPKTDIDPVALIDAVDSGYNTKELSDVFGVSPTTIKRRIAELKSEQKLILDYRDLQSLHITKTKLMILDKITEEKVAEASFRDLIGAYKALNDAELNLGGKPTGANGLVGILMMIEKEAQGSSIIEGNIIEEEIPENDESIQEADWSPIE